VTARGAQAALEVAIYIPADVDSGGQVRVWMNGSAGAVLIEDVRLQLTQGLRLKALSDAGVDPLAAAQIEAVNAPLLIAAPEATAGAPVVHSAAPVVLAYLLLISTIITGSMMLQGLVEERSNKLLEAVLACVSPRELMLGKLLGISALGLSIIGIWIGAAAVLTQVEPASSADSLLQPLALVRHTPWIGAALIFYFLAGYLTIGMIFLGVGALSDSMQDVQGYLMPLALLIVGPSVALVRLIYGDPNSIIARIVTWIPLYTPMVMLARLQSGISPVEVVATALLLLAFGALEMLLLGRLFNEGLIRTGQALRMTPGRRRAVLRLAAIGVALAAVTIIARHHGAPAPENETARQTAAQRKRGQTVFQADCSSCHDPAVARAPSRQMLAAFPPDRIVEALASGVMKPMAAGLSDRDRRSIAVYLTGREPVGASAVAADPPRCKSPGPFSLEGPAWNGWGGPRNWRIQHDPGFPAAEVSRLEPKWALAYGGGKYGQPTLAGGRLFLTSLSGVVYSLDAKTGCMVWRFAQSTPSRTTVTVGALPGGSRRAYAAYFGDLGANVYAADADTGALLWKTRVDEHPRAVLTGTPLLFEDRLYVPVSSWEEGVASLAQYSCCTFQGGVAALDAATGRVLWKASSMERPPQPIGRNTAGAQKYGPAGGAVWSAPTIDAKRRRLYFATGNSYTDAPQSGADAVIAVDLANGAVLWRRQLTLNDNSLSGCARGRRLVNCPSTLGDDYDFGASTILLTLPSGKDILLAGQKSGAVLGIDPDTGGILWRTQVGVGGFLGGIEWGMASDGARLYVANADVLTAAGGRPGLYALDPATGKDLWYTPSPPVGCAWSGLPCVNAQSAAPSLIPGVIFAGSTDGHERAYSSVNGAVLWDFDTAGRTYRTINGVAAQGGGAIDVSSGTLADGMLFMVSGYLGNLGGSTSDVVLAFSVDGR
jgi:polyvinyl alcohol dehydrogenase (cytochrome)